MIRLLFITPFIVSFLVTLLCVPYWIRRARKAGLVGRDMHKLDKRLVAELGGVPVVVGFLVGTLLYGGILTFYLETPRDTYQLFSILLTVLIAAMIGLIDDILGWKIGLRQWQKPVLTLLAALPMVMVNAGSSQMGLPFRSIELSYIYPFLFIPLGIVGATNGFNMIGGYNGLEAGMGFLILSTLGIIAYLSGKTWLTVIVLCMVSAILAFLFFNWYPARIFPGNMFTYLVGAFIASIAIMGNSEKMALLLFLPYFFELILKARGAMQKESFARVLPDGTLDKPYEKWYGLEHMTITFLKKIKGSVRENDVVHTLLFIELMLAVLALNIVYFKIGVF